jgi:hypothetical protein
MDVCRNRNGTDFGSSESDVGAPEARMVKTRTMAEPQGTTSPKFYRNAIILFVVIGCILLWQAIGRRDWFYGVFAGITFLNALMAALKLNSLRETKS